MGVTIFNKELSKSSINCGESFNVQLSLTAEPDITSNPTDIVLILDHSGSMSNSMVNLKNGYYNLKMKHITIQQKLNHSVELQPA